jgi:hypothetical protein
MSWLDKQTVDGEVRTKSMSGPKFGERETSRSLSRTGVGRSLDEGARDPPSPCGDKGRFRGRGSIVHVGILAVVCFIAPNQMML